MPARGWAQASAHKCGLDVKAFGELCAKYEVSVATVVRISLLSVSAHVLVSARQ